MKFHPMHEIIPEGKKGVAQIRHFEITEKAASVTALRAVVAGRPWEVVNAGKYCSLFVNGHLVMSDTQMEQTTNGEFLRAAEGRTLIAGLGVGMIVYPLLNQRDVTDVVVVEKHQDVIDLVHPHLKHSKLQVVCADIWEYEADGVFDTMYFDIWNEVNMDNYDDMVHLENKFRPSLRYDYSWMGCWSESILDRLASYAYGT